MGCAALRSRFGSALHRIARPIFSLPLLLAAAAVFVAGCGAQGGGGPPPEMIVEVTLGKPEVLPVEDILAAVGTIEANERVVLKPEAAGILESIHFTEGRRVRRGERLFELDAKRETALLAQAEAEQKLAETTLRRAKTLLGTRAISDQEVDQLENQTAVRSASLRVERQRLAERTVLAPFDGVLGPRLVSPGQYVEAGTGLAVLVDDSEVKVRFRIPERHLAQIRPGQQGRLRTSAYADQTFDGVVDLIDPEVDPSTRTVEVRLRVPNPDGLLKPGMFARVELVVGSREMAIVIPEEALLASLDKFSVFAVVDERAQSRPVVIGNRLPGKVEIREGISADEQIVLSGTQKVLEGIKVKHSEPAPAGAESN